MKLAAIASGILVAVTSISASRQLPVVEHVEVGRVLFEVRVVDRDGRPVRDLDRADFAVTIDGKPARVDRAAWQGADSVPTPQVPAPDSGRIIVFFVQQTMQGTVTRRDRDLIALRRVLESTDAILAGMRPSDRIAVVSFDTRLKVWSDFTRDVTRVRRILKNDMLVGQPGPTAASNDPSLLSTALQEEAVSAYTIEASLRLVGEALKATPGPKTMVLVGYGFGEGDALNRTLAEAALSPGLMNEDYDAARRALVAARTSILSIDVTDAHRHALDVGLQRLAEDTGGVFARAHPLPDVAVKLIGSALEGYYTLSVERPRAAASGAHRLSVRVDRGGHRAYAPSAYFD